jgi:hypothetical protein
MIQLWQIVLWPAVETGISCLYLLSGLPSNAMPKPIMPDFHLFAIEHYCSAEFFAGIGKPFELVWLIKKRSYSLVK